MISNTTIEKVRSLAIVDVLRTYVKDVKKEGANYKALSPFTEEKTPSFIVSPSKQIFKCFSTGEGGDAISFVMKHKNLTFYEAIQEIASDHQIDVEFTELTQQEKDVYFKKEEEQKATQLLLNYASNYFHTQEIPKTFREKRGFTEALIDTFHLGYADAAWQSFTNTASKAQYTKERLVSTGLMNKKDQRHYDTLRDRCIFPIHDAQGKVIAFAGRTLDDAQKPKYLNSPSSLWEKGKHLYGLHIALKTIQQEDYVYLAEGYTDVIAMHAKDIKNVVASCGTAFTDTQAQLIKRYTDNVCIVPDDDVEKKINAGIEAAHKTARLLIRQGFTVEVLIPNDAKRQNSNDADSFLRDKTQEEVNWWINQKQDYITEFLLNECILASTKSPKATSIQIQRIIGVLETIQDPMLYSAYVEQVSTRWSFFKKNYKKKAGNTKVTKDTLKKLKTKNLENYYEDRFWEANGITLSIDKEKEIELCRWTIDIPYFINSSIDSGLMCRLSKPNGYTRYSFFKTDDLNSRQSFRKVTERLGFVFKGRDIDLDAIKEKKIEEATKCYAVSTLGHNYNMYVWSNGIHYNNTFFKPDPYGVVSIKKPIQNIEQLKRVVAGSIISYENEDILLQSPTDFINEAGEENIQASIEAKKIAEYATIYIPYAQAVKANYDGLTDPYLGLKRFKYKETATLTFESWMKLFCEVYHTNARIGIGFYVMALFRDTVFKANHSYIPQLFCFGPKEQGKSTFARSLMYLFGIPPESDGITLEGGTTATALYRTLSTYSNALIWFNEYKNTLHRTVLGAIKGISDGSGKKIALKTMGTETKVMYPYSTAILCGQDLPTADPATFSRMIPLEFDGSYRNVKKYNELNDLQKNLEGTNVTAELLQYRPMIEKHYFDTMQKVRKVLRTYYVKKTRDKDIQDRAITNFASISTVLFILAKYEKVSFPFTLKEYINTVLDQMKLSRDISTTTQETDKFFEILVALAERAGHEGAIDGKHFQISINADGQEELRINLSSTVFQNYAKECRKQGIEPMGTQQLKMYLRQHETFKREAPARYRCIRAKNGNHTTSRSMFFNYEMLRRRGIEILLDKDLDFNPENVEA